MAGNQVHYEVYLKKGPKAGWALVEALDDRKKALDMGKGLLEESEKYSVRVTKETFKADGDFLTITLFEQGYASDGKDEDEDKEVEIPCFKTSDLYSIHARATIAKALEGALSRWMITPSELMHSPEWVEKLELAGTELQHAVQKVSIIQSGERGDSVQKVVKKLNELVFAAIEQVHADGNRGVLGKSAKGDIVAFATKVAAKGDAGYRLRGAVAEDLKSVSGWSKKLAAALDMLSALPEDEAVRTLCLEAVDDFAAEILSSPAKTKDLFGPDGDLGDWLTLMIETFLGAAHNMETAPKGVRVLSGHFAKDRLPCTRTALGERILQELMHGVRLREADLRAEVKLVRKLASRIILGQGPHLSVDQIQEAFTRRSRRFVTPEAITEYGEDAQTPIERICLLFDMEENIVGTENRRALSGFIMPLVSAANTETYILELKESSVRKLQRVAQMQKRADESNFPPDQKRALKDAFDLLAVKVEERLGLLQAIERQPLTTAERTLALLRLVARGVLTEGECAMRAKRIAAKLMRDPAFMEGFVKGGANAGDPKAMLMELKSLMSATGLNRFGVADGAQGEKPKAKTVN